MEVDEETDSQYVIPESPPLYTQGSSTSRASRKNPSPDEDEEDMEIEDYDEDEDFQAKKKAPPPPPQKHKGKGQKCNYNVVIDIDLEDDDIVEVDSPPRTPVKGGDKNASLRSDDPFLNDDDDVDLMAEVEQIEKILNGEEPQGQPIHTVANFDIDLDDLDNQEPEVPGGITEAFINDKEELEEKERLRKEEVDKMARLGPQERIFPDVRASNFHTVAFFMKTNYQPGDDLSLHPQTFVSTWDPQYVPMPCANENIRVFKVRQQRNEDTSNGTESPKERSAPTFSEKTVWMWDRIEQALSLPMYCTQDISTAMKQYCRSSSEFRALNYAIEKLMTDAERDNFFSKVMPCMQTLCLDVGRMVTCPLPFLKKFSNYSVSLSQKQIASLLANAFFSTFPRRFDDELQYPSINFNELFQCPEDDDENSRLVTKAHKIRCLLYYFTRISYQMPKGVVTYTRRSIRNSKAPDWPNSTKPLTKIIPLAEGTIEDDGVGMLQVDFANKIIGGGVLGGGAVQEEILFVTYPELLLSRLFTEKLTSCEAVIVTGCERFSRYSGYARNFKFDGGFFDTTPCDSKGRKCTQFVAIDALYITRPVTQFHPRFLTRELNKAFVGFSSSTPTLVPVATGKWGCGAFNGNPQLKAILQLLSASQTGRNIVFFTFGDTVIQKEIEEMYSVVKNMTIQEVWKLLTQYYSLFCTTNKPKCSLSEYLVQFGSGQSLPTATTSSSSAIVSRPCPNDSDFEKTSNGPGTKKFKEVPITNFYSRNSKSSSNTSNNSDSSQRRGESSSSQPSSSNSTVSDEKDFQTEWKKNLEVLTSKANSKTKHSGVSTSTRDGTRGDITLSEEQISDLLCQESQDNDTESSAIISPNTDAVAASSSSSKDSLSKNNKKSSNNPFAKKIIDLASDDESYVDSSSDKKGGRKSPNRLALTDFYK